jgi:hypothetical protein
MPENRSIVQYHLILSVFLLTAGLATAIPPESTARDKRICTLLKLSERMSNVPLGVRPRVAKRSNPYAKRRDVDSANVGEVARRSAPRT